MSDEYAVATGDGLIVNHYPTEQSAWRWCRRWNEALGRDWFLVFHRQTTPWGVL